MYISALSGCAQALSNKLLVMLLGVDPSQAPHQPLPTEHPQVTFAYIKHTWKSSKQDQAHSALVQLVENSLAPKAKALLDSDDLKQKEEINKLLARSDIVVSRSCKHILIQYAIYSSLG